MVEFNEDGSIKLPERMQKAKDENSNKMQTQRCIKIRKELVNDLSPKKCELRITLSSFLKENNFVEKTYGYFLQTSEVPSKLRKINEKEFVIEIGTCFRRCSDCTALIKRFKEFLYNNVIEEQGTCTYERKEQNFCYEDYF